MFQKLEMDGYVKVSDWGIDVDWLAKNAYEVLYDVKNKRLGNVVD